MEEWMNKVLEAQLVSIQKDQNKNQSTDKPASSEDQTLFKKDKFQTPAKELGVDLQYMNRQGITFDEGRRLQRAMYVHSTGFHAMVK